jgi:NAD(P)-dependent dehydrogenase (short-subunit alcohol dehydrogenase family)
MAPMLLPGKTALITGAAQGIGKGIALELAREGCDVAVNDLNPSGAENTAREVRALGRKSIAVVADVGVSADVDRMFREVIESFTRLDILVNNAGIQTWASLLDLQEVDWDRVLATNLKGCYLCTQHAGRHMKEMGGGRIINLGSGCNKFAFPNLVDYTASRGGVEMFTKSAAVELGPYQITVNCVAPGAIETGRTRNEAGDYAGTWAKLTPLGRVGTPLDVGRVVTFFASDASAFVTGQTIWVDGGLYSKPAWPY